MKKHYETPTVEKIQFNYREQVVAASGTSVPGPDSQRPVFSDACDVMNVVVLGYDVCSRL